MRIKILQRPTHMSVDGMRMDSFEPGRLYDVGTALACLFLCEGWAEPVPDESPAVLIPLASQRTQAQPDPPNLTREVHPPQVERHAVRALAAHMTRQKRRSRKHSFKRSAR